MAHNKVYGICENKCQVEVLPKSKAFGIDEADVYPLGNNDVHSGGIGTANRRIIYKNYKKAKISVDGVLQDDGTIYGIDNNFNFEVVFFRKDGFAENSLPSNVVSVTDITMLTTIPIKFITPYNFKLSNYTTAHFYFFWDGLNLCCRVEGY